MTPMLALIIDDTIVNWILGTAAVVLPATGTALVMAWRNLGAYFGPLIRGLIDKVYSAFDAHTSLATEMKNQIPIVGETLKKLGDTQEKQCETLDQHSKILETHQGQLKEIMTEVRKINTPSFDSDQSLKPV